MDSVRWGLDTVLAWLKSRGATGDRQRGQDVDPRWPRNWESVPHLASEPTALPQVLRRREAVEEIRRKRAEGIRSFRSALVHSSFADFRSADFLRAPDTHAPQRQVLPGVVGHPGHGVPFGQDRLVLLWLATVAVRQENPVVRFESAEDILNEWGLPTNRSHYKRLAEAFGRVFGSTMFCVVSVSLRRVAAGIDYRL